MRETLKDYMKKTHNVGREFDELVVTSGAQQVMDLTTKSLCNAGMWSSARLPALSAP